MKFPADPWLAPVYSQRPVQLRTVEEFTRFQNVPRLASLFARHGRILELAGLDDHSLLGKGSFLARTQGRLVGQAARAAAANVAFVDLGQSTPPGSSMRRISATRVESLARRG
jgi:hypothetical protein